MDEMKSLWTEENRNMSKALFTLAAMLDKNGFMKIAENDEKYKKFTEALYELRRQVKQMNTTEEIPF